MAVYIYELDDLIIPFDKSKEQPLSPEIISKVKEFFGLQVGGNICLKRHEKSNKQLNIILYCNTCNKFYKLQSFIKDLKDDSCMKFLVKSPSEIVCLCPSKTLQIRGPDRDALKEKLKHQTPSQIYSQAFTKPLTEDCPPPPQLGTIHKALSELRERDDLHDDTITDALLRFRTKQLNNIQEVSVYTSSEGERFRMILTSDHANKVLEKFLLDKDNHPFKRLLLDATGKITAPINEKDVLHHVLLIAIPKFDSEKCFLVPVGEMVTDDHTGENIGYFLRFILSRVHKPALNRLRQIGTDDSWANVHAIFTLTPGMTVMRYLQLSFDVFLGGQIPLELVDCVAPAYCFSHFSKNWKMTISEAYDDKDVCYTVRAVLTEITTIEDAKKLDTYVKALIVLLLSEHKTPLLKAARKILGRPDEVFEINSLSSHSIIEEPSKKVMYRDSPFYQHYSDAAENFRAQQASLEGTENNKFWSESLFVKLLKHYFPYLPFWTIFISRLQHSKTHRNNNARIERYFLRLKDECCSDSITLTRLGNIKLGRYASFRANQLECLLNEVDAQQLQSRSRTNQPRNKNKPGTSNTSQIQEQNLSQQEEKWSKSRRSRYGDLARKKLDTEFMDD
jgi:hypothetical protein